LRLIRKRRPQSILQDTQSPQPSNIVILGADALAQAVHHFDGRFAFKSQA